MTIDAYAKFSCLFPTSAPDNRKFIIQVLFRFKAKQLLLAFPEEGIAPFPCHRHLPLIHFTWN